MWMPDVTLVLPDCVAQGALRIEDGRIAEITLHGEPPEAPTLTVMPGFVDMHGDMIEHEIEPRPNVDFPMPVALNALDARLASAGVTTAYAAVSFSRGAADNARRSYAHTSEVIRNLAALRDTARVDHRIHARFDVTFEGAVSVLAELLERGHVDLVSLMDHTPGQGQYRNLETHIKNRAAQLGLSDTEARQRVATTIAERTRPPEVLLATMRDVAQLCAAHGVALASHDDDTVEKADLMADLGAVISEFPVTVDAARRARKRGMMTAMGAPNALRGMSYSGNLSARAAHAEGLLSMLAADYHPAAILPALYALSHDDPDGLAGATRLATAHPAQALGLTDRGTLEEGKRADLVLVDAGGRVAMTLRGGNVIYSNGTAEPCLRR